LDNLFRAVLFEFHFPQLYSAVKLQHVLLNINVVRLVLQTTARFSEAFRVEEGLKAQEDIDVIADTISLVAHYSSGHRFRGIDNGNPSAANWNNGSGCSGNPDPKHPDSHGKIAWGE